MDEVYVHRKVITRSQKQKLTTQMFDRLKENPNDSEARRWLKECGFTYVKLTKENGGSVEVRV